MPDKITYESCRAIERPDGLKMKAVQKYTFRGFIEAISSRWGDQKAYCIFGEPKEKDISYNKLKALSDSIGTYLLEHGIRKGDKIAVMGESCPHWMTMYLGISTIGAVTVPILPDFSKAEVREILTQSEAKGICINMKQYKKAEELVKEKNLLLVRMDDLTLLPSDTEDFQKAEGLSLESVAPKQTLLDGSQPEEEDLASIIFTSGTTGSSKGVMLSHKNLIVCGDEASDVYVRIDSGDRVLSILPMSHCYEFVTCHMLTLLRGAEITFLGKPPATTILMKAFRDVRPHIILTVPLLIEKIYRAAVVPTIRDNKKIAALLKCPLTSWIVYNTVRNKLVNTMGGCMKFFGIGGAPLDKEVEEFLFKCKFPYAPGYGLTETAPLIAASGPKKKEHRLFYIGKVVKHDSVILLDQNEEGVGEIAVKGPNVMMGYYKRDDLNKEVFTEDGYFKTGDLGAFNKEGFLAIKGRVKTMILGPAGENIYPEPIEGLINNQEFVEESLVVPSDGGLMALVKIDMKAMQEKMKISAEEAKVEAGKYIVQIKAKVNEQLSSFSRISETKLQDEPFERTPTQKIKRFLYSAKGKNKEKK